MTPAETLRKAADVIRERGWYQGDFEKYPGGPCCASEAIYRASGVYSGNYSDQRQLLSKAFDFLSEAAGLSPSELIAPWNDAPERTADEVIAALLKAADLAEGK